MFESSDLDSGACTGNCPNWAQVILQATSPIRTIKARHRWGQMEMTLKGQSYCVGREGPLATAPHWKKLVLYFTSLQLRRVSKGRRATAYRSMKMKVPLICKTLTLTLSLAGVVLVLHPATWASSFKLLHNFGSGHDGATPLASPIQDHLGNLYGTTGGGGANAGGTVFELLPNLDGSWNESIVYDFDFYSDVGSNPAIGVALDRNGNLYGSTVSGGPNDAGTVFELSPGLGGWSPSPIYTANGSGSLQLDAAANLYTTLGPGAYDLGAIAELSPAQNGWAYEVLHSFCPLRPCPDGLEALTPLAWDAAGNLYGTTLHGGIYPYPNPCADNQGCGVAFQMRPRPDGTWSYRILHWFGSFVGDGELLNGGIVVDGKGNVYGSSGVGGPTFSGTVFRLSPHPSGEAGPSTLYSETQLYTFPDCSQGCGPENPLVMDKAGNLYGTAGGGNMSCAGNAYCGVVFRLAPQKDGTWRYSTIYKFSGPDGFGPAGVAVGSDGNLYGTTRMGGQFNFGVAFEITP